MSYAAEPYAQFVDDLLAGLTGGEVRQRFVFLPEEAPFRLAAPAPVVPSTLRLFGQAGGAFHRFRPGDDFAFDGETIEWRPVDGGAVVPDEGTAFYANFEMQRPDAALPLTDRNPGSVTRLLAESFAREYAVLSRQLETVYRSGFLETAEGRDLDELASLVGVERRGRTHAAGSVVFARTSPSPADVSIPAGTRLSTVVPPLVELETTEDRTLRRGELSVEVPVAALATGPAGVVAAGAIAAIHRPLLGIESVANPQPTRFAAETESDAALRGRARRALEGAGAATPGALLAALTTLPGVTEKQVRISEDHLRRPGVLELQVDLPGDLAGRAAERVEEVRPAGVRVHTTQLSAEPAGAASPSLADPDEMLAAGAAGVASAPEPPSRLPVEVALVVVPAVLSLTAAERDALKRQAGAALAAFFERAGIGETLVYNRLVAELMAIPGVLDVNLWWGPAGQAKHRRNLSPEDPSRRPVLGADPDLRVGGRLVLLYVTAVVELREVGRLGDRTVNLREAKRQIEGALRQGAATLQGELTVPALAALLGNPAAFTADLHYVADYVEASVRIHQRDVALPLTGLEGVWIASVALEERTS